MMESREVPVILCFNKTDIADDPDIEELRKIYEGCGYPLVFTSAKEEKHIDELKAILKGKTTSDCRTVRSRKIIYY